MRASRGMALIQALVIVAAIAAVSAALLLRAETGRARLQTRFQADQAALYLQGGASLVSEMLSALGREGVVHRRQDWARPRDGVLIGEGVLAWQVDDLHGRFNVNSLDGEDPTHLAARAAFLRLATDQGLSRRTAQRLADSLGPDAAAREAAVTGDPPPLPLADPRQLAPVARDEPVEFARLLPYLAALPPNAKMNINTLQPPVLEALLPDIPSSQRRALEQYLRRDPVTMIEALVLWAGTALGPEIAARLEAMPLSVSSLTFVVTLELRLDSLRLRRSFVLNREPLPGQSALILSISEPD